MEKTNRQTNTQTKEKKRRLLKKGWVGINALPLGLIKGKKSLLAPVTADEAWC